jgi:hypothetical protein
LCLVKYRDSFTFTLCALYICIYIVVKPMVYLLSLSGKEDQYSTLVKCIIPRVTVSRALF